MENFIRRGIVDDNKFYKVVKVFFEIDSKKIDFEKSTLVTDEQKFKLDLFSVDDICCPIGYEVLHKQEKLEIRMIIDNWVGAFDTEFDLANDLVFQDEKYVRAVLKHEINVIDYCNKESGNKQKSIITYYENITGRDELRKIRFGVFSIFDWITRKQYVSKHKRFSAWL